MNATELLAELRPLLDEFPADDGVLERIPLATPEPSPPRRRRRLTRPLAVAGATTLAATAAVAFVPAGGSGPVGLSDAVAAHRLEWAYDRRGRRCEIYVPERDEVIVHTTQEIFEDMPDPFGSIAGSAPSNPTPVGDLPALLTRALRGVDPNVRHVGRTRLRGNALPVRVVDHIEALGNAQNATSISEFTGAQKLTLDASTESSLKLTAHPGAKRTIRPPFDDPKADG